MATTFRIGVNTDKQILSTPPPQFKGVNLIYTPFAVHVGKVVYPMPIWTDFAGVFLFKWYKAVLRLESGNSRGTRLPFWYRYEMWLQQRPKQRWRLSLVQEENDEKRILHKTLVIPEVVEAALLSAIQKLLEGARNAGVWPEDCVALDALVKGRHTYLDDMKAGRIPRPSFLSGRAPVRLKRDQPMLEIRLGPPIPLNDERCCPRCGVILNRSRQTEAQQVCPICGNEM